MVKIARLAVCVTAAIVLSYGQEANPKPKEQQPETTPQQQQPPTPPVPAAQAPAGTVPAAQPPDSGKPPAAQPPAVSGETDPLKMAPSNPAGDKTHVPTETEKTYILGADDIIVVAVWASPQLSGSYIIRPDGRISMPLVGEIAAAGLTPVALGERITDRLKEGGILRQPNVVVVLQQVKSKKIQILGEVRSPGSFPITAPTTILEALVNAGGFNDFANKRNIILQRQEKCAAPKAAGSAQAKGKKGQAADPPAAKDTPDSKCLKRYKFNYNEVLKGHHLEQNIMVEPGDLIIVK
jgi:polysaccharide export outer membrane protein